MQFSLPSLQRSPGYTVQFSLLKLYSVQFSLPSLYGAVICTQCSLATQYSSLSVNTLQSLHNAHSTFTQCTLYLWLYTKYPPQLPTPTVHIMQSLSHLYTVQCLSFTQCSSLSYLDTVQCVSFTQCSSLSHLYTVQCVQFTQCSSLSHLYTVQCLSFTQCSYLSHLYTMQCLLFTQCSSLSHLSPLVRLKAGE